MFAYAKGTAEIEHRETAEVFKIEGEKLDWDIVDTEARQMGAQIHHCATIEHPVLGTLSWSVWEYPEGMENDKETEANGHEVVKDFDYGLEHAPDED